MRANCLFAFFYVGGRGCFYFYALNISMPVHVLIRKKRIYYRNFLSVTKQFRTKKKKKLTVSTICKCKRSSLQTQPSGIETDFPAPPPTDQLAYFFPGCSTAQSCGRLGLFPICGFQFICQFEREICVVFKCCPCRVFYKQFCRKSAVMSVRV